MRITFPLGHQALLFVLTTAMLFAIPNAVHSEDNAKSAITKFEPRQAIFGKTNTIELEIENIAADTQLALQPAGPYSPHHLLRGQSIQAIAIGNNRLYAATADNQIVAINLNDSDANIASNIAVSAAVVAMRTADDHLIIATADGELILFNVNNSELSLSHRYNTGGQIRDFAIDQQYLYVLQEQQLQILSRTPKVKLVSRLSLGANYNSVSLQNRHLYLSGNEWGVTIVDVRNAQQAKIGNSFATPGNGAQIRSRDGIAYLADGAGGLAIIDPSDPDSIRWLGSHNKLGEINALLLHNDLAIVNNANRRLVSIDISNHALPITASIYKPHNDIIAIDLRWPNVYVATDDGIEVVDFSIAANTQISNEGINHGGSRRAFIRDDIAYVADWFSGLHLYDIRIPHAPRHLGNFHTPGSSKGVIIKDNYAFVGDDDHGLQVIDISNPRQPRAVSQVLSTGLAYTMKLVDNLIYLADHRGGFHIIDITDVTQPRIIGSFDTPSKSWAIDVADNIAYVADDASGLLIFDVSDTKNIKIIGQFNPGGYAEDVKVIGSHAYVAFFDKGLYIVDISDPRDPQAVGHTSVPGNARSVSVQGAYAYVAGWESGIQIIDIRNLNKPKIVAYYDTDGSAWGLDLHENYAYVWDWWGGVKVIDIGNPLKPQLAGNYHTATTIERLTIAGNYIYTANGPGGMQVYDAKNPLNPIWATGLDVRGSVHDVVVQQGYAYIAAGDGGVIIADVSDPFYIRWQSQLQSAGDIRRIHRSGNALLAIDADSQLRVFDRRDPQQITLKRRYPWTINDLHSNDNYIYTANTDGSLDAFRLSPQLDLELVAKFKADTNIALVRAWENNIFAYEPGVGIHILKWRGQELDKIGEIPMRAPVDDMQANENGLYLSSKNLGLLQFDLATPGQPQLNHRYPATGPMSMFRVNDQGAFFAGDRSITSVSLGPHISIERSAKNPSAQKVSIKLPDTMPMGDYRISLINAQGEIKVLPEILSVKMRKPKKPKFTMEDFKKILKQQQQQAQPAAPKSP
ncbi:hypothetical protein [Kaarinaea lacus]